MVVPSDTEFSKALYSPLGVAQDIFEECKDASASEYVNRVQSHFNNVFARPESKSKVPALTEELLEQYTESSNRTPKLVRWRCMVQDTSLGNEVLPFKMKTSNGEAKNALFGATSLGEWAGNDDSAQVEPTNMSSLTTMYGVSIPGQTEWSRRQDELLDTAQREPLEDLAVLLQRGSLNAGTGRGSSGLMRNKLPTGEGSGALLKLYDEEIAEAVRVAQVVDIIGILDENVLPSANWSDLGSPSPTAGPSPNHTTIHVIAMNPAEIHLPTPETVLSESEKLRGELIEVLARTVGGDRQAAEWVLLGLLAKIHTRKSAHVLGSLSVNLSAFPTPLSSSQEPALIALLSLLKPALVHQSLSLGHLNDKSIQFAPKSDADDNGLQAGRLQLVDGTVLVIDESAMQEGQLQERGIENIRALSEVLEHKKLTYQFPYSKLEMDIDLNFLILSQGKSFLPVDVQVKLSSSTKEEGRTTESFFTPITDILKEVGITADTLARWRSYLKATQLAPPPRISENISEQIQDEFVKQRREGKKMEQEDLVRRMNVARLVAASKGKSELEWDAWQDASSLDEDRIKRLE